MNGQMKGFVNGVLFSLVGKPLRITPREPVAYLYNGVRLPDINSVWDKETYPYAYICTFNTAHPYCVFFATNPFVVKDTKVYAPDGSTMSCYWTDSNNEYWEHFINQTANGDLGCGSVNTFVWASCDLTVESGTVYLTASEPIPVYE